MSFKAIAFSAQASYCSRARHARPADNMRVGIISSNSLLRQGLVALLSAQENVSIGWQIPDVQQMSRAGAPELDVLLLDSENDALDRILLEEAQAQFPKSKIVVLYELPSEELMVETLLAGARGCLSKVRDGEIFLKAIGCVARDELWANRRITARALQKGAKIRTHYAQDSSQLSPREWEVFSLVAVGKRNRQIASTLCISEQTVKRHLYSVYRKLRVPSRLEAGLLFYRMSSGPKDTAPKDGALLACSPTPSHA